MPTDLPDLVRELRTLIVKAQAAPIGSLTGWEDTSDANRRLSQELRRHAPALLDELDALRDENERLVEENWQLRDRLDKPCKGCG